MKIQSSGFKNSERLPDKFALDHENLSPPLAWSDVPDGTQEFALICDDPDAPMGTWVHWVLYGIPANVTELPNGLSKGPELKDLGGAKQGNTGFQQVGYDGPRPPKGPEHRYFFKLYALSEKMSFRPGMTADQVRNAIEGKVLAEAEIMGKYSR